jgi:hypothetical protein
MAPGSGNPDVSLGGACRVPSGAGILIVGRATGFFMAASCSAETIEPTGRAVTVGVATVAYGTGVYDENAGIGTTPAVVIGTAAATAVVGTGGAAAVTLVPTTGDM